VRGEVVTEKIETENQDYIIAKLEDAIDAEHTAIECLRHISELVRNGRIKAMFASFAEEAQRNRNLLLKRLAALGQKDFVLEDKCHFCKLAAKSFSLFGAVNLGLELTRVCLDAYDALVEEYKQAEDRNEFRRLLKGKHKQRSFLKKERRFIENNSESNFIADFCIPHVAGKLLK
jgi:rubrerythrin